MIIEELSLYSRSKSTDDVAPGILLGDDPRSIAKGLTSKFEKLLSKTRQHLAGRDPVSIDCDRSSPRTARNVSARSHF